MTKIRTKHRESRKITTIFFQGDIQADGCLGSLISNTYTYM